MAITKVTRNFQITVPRDIRELAGINVGDTIIITTEDHEIKMKKAAKDIIEKSFNIWKDVKDSVKYIRKIRKEAEDRLKRLRI